jgi:hypothetical protein
MQGRAVAHIVGAAWSDPADMLVGQVSLFNHLQYRIVLTSQYRGPRPTIASGHAYLLGPNEVVRILRSAGLRAPPAPLFLLPRLTGSPWHRRNPVLRTPLLNTNFEADSNVFCHT